MTGIVHPYAGRLAGLATRHDKLPLVAPAMRRHLQLDTASIDVDTDVLGTFTGEVERVGTPWETAVAKARLGMATSGLPLGLATEGSFGPADSIPYLLADIELVVLVDDERGIVVGETETGFGPPCVARDLAPEDRELDSVLRSGGFPEHGLIVRPSGSWDGVWKGIHDLDRLTSAIAVCASRSGFGTAHVSSDLRAHHHPTRRLVIARAAERLAQRLASRCPTCASPGWGIARVEPGARCVACGARTRRAWRNHWACPGCASTHIDLAVDAEAADPADCPRCNP